jgi:hypothetical protein
LPQDLKLLAWFTIQLIPQKDSLIICANNVLKPEEGLLKRNGIV